MLVAGRQFAPNVALGAVGRIALVGTVQLQQVTSTPTAATITFSPAPNPGDVVYTWSTRTGMDSALSTGGYTEIASGGGGFGTKVWRKVMGATPDTTVSSNPNLDGYVTMIGAIVLRGVRSVTPEDATPVLATETSPAITTNTPGAWVLSLYSAMGSPTTADIASGPAGYDNYTDGASGSGSTFARGVALAAATKLIATPATENPGEYAGTWLTSTGITIAVRKQ